MSQSCACSLSLAKTIEKDACFKVPQRSSLSGSHAQKSSGVKIGFYHIRGNEMNCVGSSEYMTVFTSLTRASFLNMRAD